MPKDDYASAALLERWITQYGDMLVRLAYGMLRDRALCQDAAQDTLLKAWRGYHTFRGECTEKTYLTGILMNTCRDYLRTAWMRRIDRRFTPDTLPEPYVEQGVLHSGHGALYNNSVVFAANGKVLGQPQRQQYPDSEVRRFIRGGDAYPLQVLETPAGRLGVLVGSDSWYPANYQRLAAQAVQVIAVPAFISGKGSWAAPWRGNRHQPMAVSLPLKAGEVDEGQAWQQLVRHGQTTDTTLLSVFLRGQFWEVAGDGLGFVSRDGQALSASAHPGARLLNQWL